MWLSVLDFYMGREVGFALHEDHMDRRAIYCAGNITMATIATSDKKISAPL